MKKMISIAVLIFSMLCTACGSKEEAPAPVPEVPDISLQQTQMKNICELATFDCYYHNVAKYKEEDAEGFWLWAKDRRFWIEYSGIVTIGIDVSKTEFVINDNVVTITLPPAEVQGCRVDPDTLTEDSFIIDSESATVEASHQTAAFSEAQAKMEEAAAQDTTLLENARQRAKQLLEGYVNNIGETIGKKYEIVWIFPDEVSAEKAADSTASA